MNMSALPTKTVFCDWLDFTVPKSSHEMESLISFWQSLCFYPKECSSGNGVLMMGPREGVVKISSFRSVYRISVSGASIDHIREQNNFDALVLWLSENPHHITRLDAAYDVAIAGHKIIKSLTRKHKDSIKLSNRPVPVKLMLGYDLDKNKTGTFYCGHRTRARFTARVYDKKWQLEEAKGIIISDRTRYEITVRGERGKKSPCLRDFYDPTSIFWHVASPSLLVAPANTPAWDPVNDFCFSPEKLNTVLPYEKLQRFLCDSGFISTVAKLSSRLGPHGQAHALKLIKEALSSEMVGSQEDFPLSGLLAQIDNDALTAAEDFVSDGG